MYVVQTNLSFRRYRAPIRCENISSSFVNGITDVRYEMWSAVGSDYNSLVYRTTLFMWSPIIGYNQLPSKEYTFESGSVSIDFFEYGIILSF
jgi:hypothetical protein